MLNQTQGLSYRDAYEGYHEITTDIMDLSDEQSRAFWLLSSNYPDITRVVYGGAAFGGKSTLISAWLDYCCNEYPGSRWYIGRETLKDIKESVLLTFFDFIKRSGSQVKYSEQKSKLTYYNGSEIYLLETFNYPADPNFDRFGSREYTGGAIEEGVTTVKRAADILISRTRYKHQEFKLFPKQLITLNPGDGWIKDDIVIPTLEGWKPKRKSDVFVPATLNSNPNKEAAGQYRKTLEENLTAYDKARLLNGDWNAKPKSGSEWLKEFSQDRHVVKPELAQYDPTLALHISFDENVNPYITCLLFQIKKDVKFPTAADDQVERQTVYQIGEICNKPPNNTRKHVCLEIKKRFPNHVAGVFIYGDATSQKSETSKEYGENFFTDIVSELRQYNPSLRVPSKNPPVVSKGGFLNVILERRYRGLDLKVSSDCKTSINDYAYAVEDSDGGILKKRVTDPVTGISYEKHGHNCDALSYFFTMAFHGDFNYYQQGNRPSLYLVGSDRAEKFNR